MKSITFTDLDGIPVSNVIFWDHVGRGIGGIESLVINLSSEIGSHVPIKLIGEKQGVVYRTMSATGQPFRHILPNDDMNACVDRDDLLICFGGQRAYVNLLSCNPRVILWRVYPHLGVNSYLSRLLTKWTLQRLDRFGSLLFMDRFCQETTSSDLGISFASPILPIPIPIDSTLQAYQPRPISGRVSFSYIGRGTEIWKVKPVKALAQALSDIPGFAFNIHIFTDSIALFERELSSVISPEKFTVEFHMGISGTELREMLKTVADIHYGMGTSVLEGAVSGIPSIIADASRFDFPSDYKFRWLTDDIEYYAGLSLESGIRRPGRKLSDLIDEIRDTRCVERLSFAMRKAVIENFALKSVASRLLDFKPQARVSDLVRFMPSRWVPALHLQ